VVVRFVFASLGPRRCRHPTFVYDCRRVHRTCRSGRAFDVGPLRPQQACSNLAIVDLRSAAKASLVDTVSAGEIRRAWRPVMGWVGRHPCLPWADRMSAPPIVYTADIFDADSLDLCVERNVHVQLPVRRT